MSDEKREPITAPPLDETEPAADARSREILGKAATIAVVGVAAAIISTELIPGMIIGVVAAFLPGLGPKLKPMLKSTVRASYTAARKTREMFAEAGEQIQDVIAEAKSDEVPSSAQTPPAGS